MLAEDFGHQLQAYWEVESSKSLFSEIQQFRALMRSFSLLGKNFAIEEFHGTKHQVIFNGEGSWKRIPARCEISDLVIVCYRKKPTFEARITFLQAKKSNDLHVDLCSSWHSCSSSTKFQANLEQWDLLSRRPPLLPCPPFKCDPDILQGAILSSVGSLGVFHKIKNKKYDFFYTSADIAYPISSPKRKFAKLQINGKKGIRKVHGYDERIYTCCIITFGTALFNLEIGTPLERNGSVNPKDKRYRDITRGWLIGVLNSHLEMTRHDSYLARELREFIQSEAETPFIKRPPTLLVLNSDQQ
jgi:hypothetical protein